MLPGVPVCSLTLICISQRLILARPCFLEIAKSVLGPLADIARSRAALVAENAVLRQQVASHRQRTLAQAGIARGALQRPGLVWTTPAVCQAPGGDASTRIETRISACPGSELRDEAMLSEALSSSQQLRAASPTITMLLSNAEAGASTGRRRHQESGRCLVS